MATTAVAGTESSPFSGIGLSIAGVGTQYPPYHLEPDAVETLAKKFYPESPAMSKMLLINRFTGIKTRSSIGTPDHPLVNEPTAPTMTQLHQYFMSDGVPLAVSACQKALDEAGVSLTEITHMVSTTCTDSANPGYDHFVAKKLGISHQIEKVLLHGVGCSGGLAALRTAANLALGHAARKQPARILVLALEISSTLVRSELDSINELQQTRIGVVLFSDCASAVVLCNDVGDVPRPVFDLLGWNHRIIPDTEGDLGFDVDPLGWKVVLTPRVPKLAVSSLKPTLADLLTSLPKLPDAYRAASDFDWALHPGGATILSGAEGELGISSETLRASYDTYTKHGNSSSATIFSVLDRLRSKEMDKMAPSPGPKEYVVGCAFGPGVSVEMCMLKRHFDTGRPRHTLTGLDTPPESDNQSDEGNGNQESEDAQFLAEAADELELD